MDGGDEDGPPELQELLEVSRSIDSVRLPVVSLQPRLGGANEVDDLQVLTEVFQSWQVRVKRC